MTVNPAYNPSSVTQGQGRLYAASRAADKALEALREHAAICRANNAMCPPGTVKATDADGQRLRKLHRLAWEYETAEARFRFLKSKELGE